jgi:AraC-like DNA-binding protein
MTTVELIVRASACTASLILAVALLRAQHATLASRLFGSALCAGVAAYLACSGSSPVCTVIWLRPVALLAIGVPFFFWGWTTSIMEDDFAPSPIGIAGGLVLLAIGVVGVSTTSPGLNTATITLHSILGIGFVVAALVNVVRGWRQDLVEARRRLRAAILIVTGVYSIAIMSVELFLRGRPASAELLLLNAFLLAALLFTLAWLVLDVGSTVRAAFGWMPAPLAAQVEPAQVVARSREQELIDRLQQRMTADAAYRDATIAIAPLAKRMGVTEKKLRELINGRLGFRNFASYVNAFRVEEVRRRLLDPRQDEVPILTMALEAGFGSIVAFNRAFKDRYGSTPSAYRADARAGSLASVPDSLHNSVE